MRKKKTKSTQETQLDASLMMETGELKPASASETRWRREVPDSAVSQPARQHWPRQSSEDPSSGQWTGNFWNIAQGGMARGLCGKCDGGTCVCGGSRGTSYSIKGVIQVGSRELLDPWAIRLGYDVQKERYE